MHKLIALFLLPWVVLVAHVPASLAVEPATLSFGCVNVITGDYCEARTDMVVNCFEPIAIRRTHVSSDEIRNTGGIWRYGGETLTAYDTGNGIAFYLEEEGGGVVKFPSSIGAPDLGRTYCNTSGGELSGRTNLRNYRLSISGLRATLTTGSGERRIYEHLPDDAEIYYYLLRNKIIKGARWVLKEVIRPSGNRLIYDYSAPAVAESGIVKHGFKIRATDRSGSTEFGWANYGYQVVPGANLLTVKTSEMRTLERYVQIVGTTSGDFRSGDLLQDVRGPGGYTEVYHYDTRGHDIPRSLQICGRDQPEGRARRIEYYRRGEQFTRGMRHYIKRHDPMNGWVLCHLGPVGVNGEMQRLAEYRYGYELVDQKRRKFRRSGWTDVLDGCGGRIHYEYDDNNRITAIIRYNPQLVSREQLVWEEANLIARSHSDGDGKALSAVTYLYDDRGNVLEETTWGDLSGMCGTPLLLDVAGRPIDNGVERHTIRRTYSSDGFNLVLSEEDGRTMARFVYFSGTNLVKSQLIYEDGQIRERQFYLYDDFASLSQSVEDNGRGEEIDDLFGVTERKIVRYTPHLGNPGFPGEISEYRWDPASGQEIFIQREVLAYGSQHQVTERTSLGSDNESYRAEYYQYDERSRLISQINCRGQSTSYSYDANDNQTRVQTIEAGHFTDNVFDAANRLIRTERVGVDGGRLTKSFTYDCLGRKTTEADSCGRQTDYVRDPYGRIVEEIGSPIWTEDGWERPVIRREFDGLDRVIAETDARGHETRIRYNGRGDVAARTYPDGTEERFEYRVDGALIAQTARNRTTTRFERDYRGRVVKRTFLAPTGEVLSQERVIYDGTRKIMDIDAEGRQTRYAYDAYGRVSEMCKADIRTTYEYDVFGRKVAEKRWLSADEYQTTVCDYDLLDRVISQREESSIGEVVSRTDYEYDVNGNQVAVHSFSTPTECVTTRAKYDLLNRVILETDPLGAITRTTYNHGVLFEGEPVLSKTVIDPLGQTRTVLLDGGNRPVSATVSHDRQILSEKQLLYDLSGNPTCERHTVLSDREVVRTFAIHRSYGPLNRLEEVIEGWGSPMERTTRLLYNPFGQLAETIRPDGTQIARTYDSLGRLLTHSGPGFHYAYDYDLCNNLIQVASPEGSLKRRYDAADRMIEETLPTGITSRYAYDALGRRRVLELHDGSIVEYIYDSTHLRQISRHNSAGDLQYSHHYTTYDLRGHPLAETLINETTRSQAYDTLGRTVLNQYETSTESDFKYDKVGNLLSYTANDQAYHYSYDPLYQLTAENDHIYAFDSLFNRISTDGKEHHVNALNQPSRYVDDPIEHDLNGNLVKWGNDTYTYDGLGRLTEATVHGTTITYTYDAFDRCLSRTVGTSDRQCFLYDNQYEIGAVDTNLNLIEFRLLGIGRGAEIGATVAIELSGTIHTPQHDYRGSIVSLIGQTHSTHFTAFGLPDQPSTAQNPWRFMSKREDRLTGFINFGRRHYSPKLGRWLTPDPKGYQEGPNLYAYCLNRPLTNFDLWGLECEPGAFARAGAVVRQFGQCVGDFIMRLVDPERSPFTGNWGNPGPEYVVRTQGDFEVGRDVAFLSTNGIRTSFDEAQDMANQIARRTGYECAYIHNQSYGTLGDCVRAGLVRCGVKHPAVDAHVTHLREELNRIGPNGIFVWTAHSEGVMIAKQAIRELTPEQRSQVRLHACGGPVRIYESEAGRAINHVASGDLVARLGGSFLRPPPDCEMAFEAPVTRGASLKNHGFAGPYVGVAERYSADYLWVEEMEEAA